MANLRNISSNTLAATAALASALSVFAVSAPRLTHATHSASPAASCVPPTATVSSDLAAAGAARANYVATASNLRHWEKRVLLVHFTPSDDDNKTPEETRRLLTRAIGLWNDKVGETITLALTDDAATADVEMSFVAPKTLAGGAIGRTDVTFRLRDQILTHATVRINVGLEGEEFVQVAAHELGHALGIEGHSDDKRDLMYTTAHTPAIITNRDLNTMSICYAPVVAERAATAAAVALAADKDATSGSAHVALAH